MRVYLPALVDELDDDRPPLRFAYSPCPPAGMSGQRTEDLEEEALEAAALESLAILRDSGGVPRRVVLVGEVAEAATVDPADATSHVAEVAPGQLRWSDIESIHLDGPEAEPAVSRALAASTQEQADRAMAELDEAQLEWFDITELPDLVRRVRAGGSGDDAQGGTAPGA